MAKVLTVFFGAGASFDCTYRYSTEALPQLPLTQNLFHLNSLFDRENGFKNHVLRKYPGASAIGALYTNSSASGFEKFLKKQLESKDFNKIREVHQTHFFLREYVGLMSEYIQAELTATNYTNLIDYFAGLEGFDKILLITTNYDLLLDYRLNQFLGWNFRTWQDYIGPREEGHLDKWFYIKLHGSVNWKKKVARHSLDQVMRENNCSTIDDLIKNNPEAVLRATGDQEIINVIDPLRLHRPQALRDSGLWERNRFTYDQGNAEFIDVPVMVLPQDEKKPICHQSHIDRVKSVITHTSELWIVGNSLIDDHLKELIRKIPAEGLKVNVVDRGNRPDWAQKLKVIFPENAKSIQFRFADGLSQFVKGGMDFNRAYSALE